MSPAMFTSVLIANRGEIACRIISTLRRLGIRSIAVYTEVDAGARHVRLADEAVNVSSYLSIDEVLGAAERSGAAAIHPGYGFLAENHQFAARCEQAGIVFIGPSSEAIRVMGDKIAAKAAVGARKVPTVPGAGEPGMTDEQLIAAAAGVGYPLLIKPSAGGGGKGMHVVSSADELASALAAARREAASSFGDDTLLIERYLASPRHIEVQVMADAHGHVIHLGERDCTLQRRHQKVIEEAPSAIISPQTRERLGEAACETARSVAYSGAGTVEFIVSNDAHDEFFFMEMNTRLQVEHPVTEAITGLDLVELQLRAAAGERLGIEQSDVVFTGHAIEARIYAEDPMAGFLPTGGRVQVLREPAGPGVRVDSALLPGLRVSSDYDPMLAKVIAWAPDRESAIALLRRSLAETAVLGVTTNLQFLQLLLALPQVAAATMDTELIGRELGSIEFAHADEAVFATAALLLFAERWRASGDSLWSMPTGWRLGDPAPLRYRLAVEGRDDDRVRTATVSGTPAAAIVSVDDAEPVVASVVALDAQSSFVSLSGAGQTVVRWVSGGTVEFAVGGVTWRLRELPPERRLSADAVAVPTISSPMPGSVVAVLVASGDHVDTDQPLLIVEAMKMEHVLTAPSAGIARLDAAIGDHVERGQLLATIDATTEAETG
ncbi:MAG TPA: biotin carboxylase N-terminal domain-containing protein [Pseudolysinimonas sp.]|nr:biotin carboxylase N-terminal domain-containing protein [Pseudolysinimonas sp.]